MDLDKSADNILRWKRRPDLFVREVFGVTPDAWQDEVLKAFPHKLRIALKACKGPGKTSVLSWIAWNFLLTRDNPKIAATSITGANLSDNLWTEMAKWQQKSPLLKEAFTWIKTRIFLNECPETWWMSARPWSKAADAQEQGSTLAGLHADNILFLLDESGGIPESVSMAAEAALSSCVEGHIVQAGNPSDLKGMLYKSCTRDRHLWHVVEITSDPDDPMRTPRVSIEWAREQIATYGRDNPYVKVNILGQFPDAAFNSLISVEEVEAAMKRSYRESEYRAHARILGCDVARGGLDKSVIYPRQGLQMFNPMIYRNIDGNRGADIVSRKWQEWDADACFIDDTGGFGSSWLDNLNRLGFSPIGVHFSEKAANPRYYNKRTEMIFEFVQWIKRGGALPHSPEMIASLTETTYTHKGDALIIEPKELIKDRLGYSPDEMDAACFVKNTMIATPYGDKPIQFLGVGELVCTPFGDSPVTKIWITETNKLTTAKFSNGSKLCGKGEHKIFVWGAGQCRLDELSLNNEIVTIRQWKNLWCWIMWITRGYDMQFKLLVDTIRAERSVTVLAFYIVIFGLIISEIYQKGMSSIIKMKIGVIIQLKILKQCLLVSIPASIWLNIIPEMALYKKQNSTLIQYDIRHRNGIAHQKASNGTENMGWRDGKIENNKPKFAHAVGNTTKYIIHMLSIVLVLVPKKLRSGDILQIKENVFGVVKNLWLTAIGQQNVAPVSVQTENAPVTKVYNLTLEKHNAYYANDILVYNCLTFSQPVMRMSKYPAYNQNNRVRTDYNPLSPDYIKKMLQERR